MVNSNLACAVLQMHIDNLEKRNDKVRIQCVQGTRLYSMLTSEKHRSIIDNKIEDALAAIIHKLTSGKITPMMLPKESRRKSAYIYYFRWLKNAVLPIDPVKAEELAYEAYKSTLCNDLIPNKRCFDDDYLKLLLSHRRYYGLGEKESNSLVDRTLRESQRHTKYQ